MKYIYLMDPHIYFYTERKRVAAAAEQDSVCGRRCPESRVHTGCIDLIEKIVSAQTGKW